jgi:nicotinamide mononucleotide (NMN) deamidase PncC
MHDILAMGARAGQLLKARGETIAAVAGASAYFQGGAITYARPAITGLVGISIDEMRAKGIRSSSEPYALMLAHAVRDRLARERSAGVTWGLSETGAAGPNGNPYGDASGHTCMAVVGDGFQLVRTLETGVEDRVHNMWAFAEASLALLVEVLETAPAA